MLRNLRDLPRSLALSSVVAGLVAMLVGFSGPILIVVQAAEAAHLTREQSSSWLWAVTVGCGLTALLLSLWYRHPVLIAWPTASAALLVTSLPHYNFSDAIGAYLVANLAITLLGLSGLFGRVMALIPRSIIAGMLGGVLLKFGLNLFKSAGDAPWLVVVMVATYLLLRRLKFRAPSIGTLAMGLAFAALTGQLQLAGFRPELTIPQITWPTFSLGALLGLALPLFVLANASQNAPGIAVLRSFGYDTPADGPITLAGVISMLTAPFGSHGLALAAITAAICVSPDAHPDKDKRYSAGVAYGLWYMLFGSFAATAITLFAGFPKPLVAAVAGLALTGAIITALTNAMAEPSEREGALLAFLFTASEVAIFGIGAPFWGLLLGVGANYLLNGWRRGRMVNGEL